MKEIFQTQNLSVGYEGRAIVSGIEISVRQGEILTLIGPNGAGKSTILKSIARQLAPISGAVFLEGRPLERMSENEAARSLSILMTQRPRPELMTCEEVVSSGRYPYTGRLGILSAEDWEKVEQAMALTHVSELSGRNFGRISDGQRQRVMLARAICQEPKALVMDEPTSFLDVRHKLELLALLKNLVRERGLAVVLSLHELDLAQKVSNQVLCVKDGGADRLGPPEEIFSGDYIEKLYGVTRGSYNSTFGCLELEPPGGAPEVFVIGGGGSGVPVYRSLQRQGVPFAAGVLHENDLDFPVARALAAEVISERAFEPVREAAFRRAKVVLRSCRRVVCQVEQFGTMNGANRLLLDFAREQGLLTRG